MKKKKEIGTCICETCPRRFVCFTQKKVFSDPAYQAMYEAFCEEGLDPIEAVKAVREFIENQKRAEAWKNEPQSTLSPWKDDYNEWNKMKDM